jgi:hypothetical protein
MKRTIENIPGVNYQVRNKNLLLPNFSMKPTTTVNLHDTTTKIIVIFFGGITLLHIHANILKVFEEAFLYFFLSILKYVVTDT